MGLTIHYALKSSVRSPKQARELVAQLRGRAMDLPFERVDEIIGLDGPECNADQYDRQASGTLASHSSRPVRQRSALQGPQLRFFASARHRLFGLAWQGLRGSEHRSVPLPADHRGGGPRTRVPNVGYPRNATAGAGAASAKRSTPAIPSAAAWPTLSVATCPSSSFSIMPARWESWNT